jgi:hypothetical protein
MAFIEIPDKVINDPRKKVINLITKEIYSSINQAAKELNITPFSVKRSIENDWYIKGTKLGYLDANRNK